MTSEGEWETIFRRWMGSASDTEKDRREHAEAMVRDAIGVSSVLGRLPIGVFSQGSFRNNTNVPQESDVDVCVMYTGSFFYDTRAVPNFSAQAAGITPGTYPYANFKNDVEGALVAKFGRNAVKRGDKAFDVSETSYRVDADVVAAFEHSRYTSQTNYVQPPGTQFPSDSRASIINWPEQHYKNGVAKNQDTHLRFKAVTRILKSLRYEMLEAGNMSAGAVPSYLIECLACNAPGSAFGNSRVYDDVRDVITHVWNDTKADGTCSDWGEVNELKYLFRGGQPWTRGQANAFSLDAWRFVGFRS